jgi:hypothetical protein
MADRLCPPILPDHGGGHLHRIWHMLRAGEVQSPWYDGAIAAQSKLTPCLAAEPLHRALLDILKQPDHYADVARATLVHDPKAMAVPAQPALFFAVDDDPGYAGVAAVAARYASAQVVARPRDIPSAAMLLREAGGAAAPVPALEAC